EAEEVVLAHLRINRDRRGYETTSLVEAGGGRRRKGQRLLYFFRTPPGVRVGREALDSEGMGLLGQRNPHLVFDWDRLLKSGSPGSSGSVGSAGSPGSAGSGVPGSGSPGSREERRRERREQRRARGEMPPGHGGPPPIVSRPATSAEAIAGA